MSGLEWILVVGWSVAVYRCGVTDGRLEVQETENFRRLDALFKQLKTEAAAPAGRPPQEGT